MTRNTKFSVDLYTEDDSIFLNVEGNVTPYDPGRTSGPPEDCYPAEGGEVEIENVWLINASIVRPTRLEISSLIVLLDAFPKLQELTEQALANREPDYPDED